MRRPAGRKWVEMRWAYVPAAVFVMVRMYLQFGLIVAIAVAVGGVGCAVWLNRRG